MEGRKTNEHSTSPPFRRSDKFAPRRRPRKSEDIVCVTLLVYYAEARRRGGVERVAEGLEKRGSGGEREGRQGKKEREMG